MILNFLNWHVCLIFSSAPLWLCNKSQPSTVPDMTCELQQVETPRISRQLAHASGKVVNLTNMPPLPVRKYALYSGLLEAEWPQSYSAAAKIKSMKNFNDLIGNRTRNFPAFSAVPPHSRIKHNLLENISSVLYYLFHVDINPYPANVENMVSS